MKIKDVYVAILEEWNKTGFGETWGGYEILGVFPSKKEAQEALNDSINKSERYYSLKGVIKEA